MLSLHFWRWFVIGYPLGNAYFHVSILLNRGDVAPAWMMGLAVFLFGNGVFWHFASDMQKSVFLEHRKLYGSNLKSFPNLLETKLWARTRNPNYFGETLIYSSFCVMTRSWIPW